MYASVDLLEDSAPHSNFWTVLAYSFSCPRSVVLCFMAMAWLGALKDLEKYLKHETIDLPPPQPRRNRVMRLRVRSHRCQHLRAALALWPLLFLIGCTTSTTPKTEDAQHASSSSGAETSHTSAKSSNPTAAKSEASGAHAKLGKVVVLKTPT